MFTAAEVSRAWNVKLVTDFAPVTLVAKDTMLLIVSPTSGLSSISQMIAEGKAHPNKLTYGTPGIGTPHHIAGVQILHATYKSSLPFVNDLIGGQIDIGLQGFGTVLPHVQSGQVEALAMTSERRYPKMPQVPTLDESGIKGVEADQWYAFHAPKATLASVVALLNTEIRGVLALPELISKIETMGVDVITNSPEELQAFVQKDLARWAPIIGHRDQIL